MPGGRGETGAPASANRARQRSPRQTCLQRSVRALRRRFCTGKQQGQGEPEAEAATAGRTRGGSWKQTCRFRESPSSCPLETFSKTLLKSCQERALPVVRNGCGGRKIRRGVRGIPWGGVYRPFKPVYTAGRTLATFVHYCAAVQGWLCISAKPRIAE